MSIAVESPPLQGLEPQLAKVLSAIFQAVEQVSNLLRTVDGNESGGINSFGDKQLEADLAAERLIVDELRASGAVESISSEETPDIVTLGGRGYSVAFDPLDGSSIIGANFAVGSIFGVWPGSELVGRSGRDQVAAAYSIYGPRTMLVIARPQQGGSPVVQEWLLTGNQQWVLVRDAVRISNSANPPRNLFAPANLRAAAENAEYAKLVNSWIAAGFTLRYSGGMVPDVHHIIAKGSGVFCSPASPSAPPKLRLLYECAPLAFIIEAAGGASHDGRGSMLDQVAVSTADRSVVCMGDTGLVSSCIPALTSSLPADAGAGGAEADAQQAEHGGGGGAVHSSPHR